MLGERVAIVVDGGPTPGREASTIVDATGDRPRLLRRGASVAELTRCSRRSADVRPTSPTATIPGRASAE